MFTLNTQIRYEAISRKHNQVSALGKKEPLQTAKVEGIEICRIGEKYGRQVNNVNLEKHNNGTLDLDDNHWCYFYQVKEVLHN